MIVCVCIFLLFSVNYQVIERRAEVAFSDMAACMAWKRQQEYRQPPSKPVVAAAYYCEDRS